MSKILLTANSSFMLSNFRAGLIRALRDDGHELVALAPIDQDTPALEAMGVRVIALHMDAKGTSPLRDFALIMRFHAHLKAERPDLVLSYTIKNNIYGALAANWLGIPFLPNVSGLGVAFNRESALSRLVGLLYRTAFRTLPVIFFQNPDDRARFVGLGFVQPDQTRLLPGSGVDLTRFDATPLPPRAEGTIFLLVARMLREKGICEYVEAARLLRARGVKARVQLLGRLGVENKSAIAAETMDGWVREGCVEYLGETSNVPPVIRAAHCVVLPTYYPEGTPRALLEAASMGRPIITTDTPGCRNTIVPGESGLFCTPRDAGDLADVMARVAGLDDAALAAMGARARAHVEQNFDEKIVIQAYRTAVTDLLRRG